MFGLLFFVTRDGVTFNEDSDQDDSLVESFRTIDRFTVCAKGTHVTYSLQTTLVHDGQHGPLVIDASYYGDVEGSPCDNSCKASARDFDFKDIYVREAKAHCYFEDRSNDHWGDFSKQIREEYGCEAGLSGHPFSAYQHESGDGDEYSLCFGSYHVFAQCTEYGMGYGFSTSHCNGVSCNPRKVRLPRCVVDWLKKHSV